jgi:hypothetical protein
LLLALHLDDLHHFVCAVPDLEQLIVAVGDQTALDQHFVDPLRQSQPVFAARQDHREPMDLPRLHQRHRLEDLVQRPASTRKQHEHRGALHQHHLPHKEVTEVQ